MRDIEHQHQAALMTWARTQQRQWPELSLLFAIPNGGHRSKATAGRLKAEGVKAGVPDLCLPVRQVGGYAGLWIELKAPGGRLQPEQREWQQKLQQQGYCAAVCYGWEAARDEIVGYLTEAAA